MELVKPVVHKVCSTYLEGFISISQGICKYISVMATLKFTYFLIKGVMFLTIIEELL
jgi:hypothetical protein